MNWIESGNELNIFVINYLYLIFQPVNRSYREQTE